MAGGLAAMVVGGLIEPLVFWLAPRNFAAVVLPALLATRPDPRAREAS